MSAEAEARKSGTVAVFERAAETYDTVGPRFFSYFGRRLVELTPMPTGSKVLDLAAGRGAVLFPALEKIGPTGQLTAIDLAQGMVQRTAAALTERESATGGLANAQMLQMDAEQLEFEDGSFDFGLCGFGIFFFPQLGQALNEIYRVLKPGGMLVATTWGKGDERWNWMSEAGVRPKPQAATGLRRAHDGDTDWLEAALTQARFINYRLIKEEVEMTFADPEEWWASEWSHGARGCLERLTPEGLEAAKTAAFAKLEAMRQPNGIPHLYRVIYHFATKPNN